MFDVHEPEEWLDHVTLEEVKFSKKSDLEIVFLNQVAGIHPPNRDLRRNLINTLDGCIQSSTERPDRLPKHFKLHRLDSETTTKQFKLTNHTPVFTRRNRRKKFGQHKLGTKNMRYNQNYLRKLNNDNNNRGAAAMNKEPETIIRDSMISSVAVIRHMDGSMLKFQHVSNLPSALKDKYFVPSPTDVIAWSSHQIVCFNSSESC